MEVLKSTQKKKTIFLSVIELQELIPYVEKLIYNLHC